jgi:hypothetical protein
MTRLWLPLFRYNFVNCCTAQVPNRLSGSLLPNPFQDTTKHLGPATQAGIVHLIGCTFPIPSWERKGPFSATGSLPLPAHRLGPTLQAGIVHLIGCPFPIPSWERKGALFGHWVTAPSSAHAGTNIAGWDCAPSRLHLSNPKMGKKRARFSATRLIGCPLPPQLGRSKALFVFVYSGAPLPIPSLQAGKGRALFDHSYQQSCTC